MVGSKDCAIYESLCIYHLKFDYSWICTVIASPKLSMSDWDILTCPN